MRHLQARLDGVEHEHLDVEGAVPDGWRKGGIAQLTKAFANEWAAHGVNVNAVAPGYIETDNTQGLRDDPNRSRQILERIPAGRWGTAADIAGAVLFLSSPAAEYVHGVVFPVDGGWLGR